MPSLKKSTSHRWKWWRMSLLINLTFAWVGGLDSEVRFAKTCNWRLFELINWQFSVSQIKYPLGGSSKKGSHVYFLLQVFRIILLFDINVVLMLPWWPDVKIVQSDITIVVPFNYQQKANMTTFFCYCLLLGILFEVLRIKM